MKRALVLLLLLGGCKSVPPSAVVQYRGVSREENAEAVVSILKCLPEPDCDELLGDGLECGPFLWRQLNVPELTSSTSYTLPQNIASGSQEVKWEGRRCENREQCRALWRAFVKAIPQNSLQTVRSLTDKECRIYDALKPGGIAEPVFILEDDDHKVLMQLTKVNGRLTLTFIDDFRRVVVRD